MASITVPLDNDTGRASGRPVRRAAPTFSLNRVIWRWHFWAGFLAGPVLILASVTGAIYIFKTDLEPLLYPELIRSNESGSAASLAEQIAVAQEFAGAEWIPTTVEIARRREGSNSIFFSNNEHEHRRIYVDPYGPKALGELLEPNLFSVSLEIHRRLFCGTLGRILVEITTCWTVLLVLTGCYLWWPRNWKKLAGVLIPRLKGKRYILVRDLHALPGVLVAPFAVAIAATGLLYSFAWGTAFLTIGFTSGAFDISINPPQSIVAEGEVQNAAVVTADDAMLLAQKHGLPTDRISIGLPRKPTDSFSVQSGGEMGPSIAAIMHIDQYTGKVIQNVRLGELPWMAQWTQWNYPLHVGSVLGMATKIIWLLACVVLATLPITGFWMWLSRRKRGSLSLPKKLEQPLPRWLWVIIVLSGILLPLAGATMLAAGLFELVACRWRSGVESK